MAHGASELGATIAAAVLPALQGLDSLVVRGAGTARRGGRRCLMSTDPQSPFEGVAIVRLRPLFFVLTALYLAALASCFQPWWYGVTPALYVNLVPLASLPFLLSRARWLRREVPAGIGVRDDHLLVDGNPVCPLRAITSVSVVAGDGEARTVSLERRWGRAVVLRVRDEDHVAALMRALGLGPTQWAASYALPPQRGDLRSPLMLGLVTGVFLLVRALAPPLLASLWVSRIPAANPRCLAARAICDENARAIAVSTHDLAVSTFTFKMWSIMMVLWAVVVGLIVATSAFKPRLLVGTDGISLTFKRRTRFVPYDEIANVTVVGSRVMIALTTGEMLAFNAGSRSDSDAPRRIVERIREAKAAASSDADVHALLLRCSGSPAARIHALRGFGREGGEGEYRSAPVTTEQLWRAFESSSADPEARANAAIALRARLDDSCRRRLRIVAAATAAPKLRSAIESAASDDDESLEEALAALEHEAAEERAVQRVEAR